MVLGGRPSGAITSNFQATPADILGKEGPWLTPSRHSTRPPPVPKFRRRESYGLLQLECTWSRGAIVYS